MGSADMAPATPFAGTWSGTLLQSQITCADGSSSPAQSTSTTIAITQSGPTITWQAQCGTFVLTVEASGTKADQTSPLFCAPRTVNGAQVVTSFDLTTATVNGNALTLSSNIESDVTPSGGATVNCVGTLSGTLAKQ